MPSDRSVPSSTGGFTVLCLSLPPLPAFPTPATHYLYIAPHESKIPSPAAARSLFLVNVPFDATEAHIKHLFSSQLALSHGRIEDVQFEADKKHGHNDSGVVVQPALQGKRGKKRKRPSGDTPIDEEEGTALPSVWDRRLQRNGGSAVVSFIDRTSMETALKEAKKKQKTGSDIIWGDGIDEKLPKLGSARYLQHGKLSYPEKTAVLESVNNFMTVYAEREASRARTQARLRQQPDADGFITVTKGGRTAPARQEVAQELAKKQKEKRKGLDDFYRFQMRERQKARAGELMRKFEQDKEKVKKMRERRGAFKPE